MSFVSSRTKCLEQSEILENQPSEVQYKCPPNVYLPH